MSAKDIYPLDIHQELTINFYSLDMVHEGIRSVSEMGFHSLDMVQERLICFLSWSVGAIASSSRRLEGLVLNSFIHCPLDSWISLEHKRKSNVSTQIPSIIAPE